VNKHAFFSTQLAKCLFHVEWHYITLLSVTIECVSELPDDCDALINELLLHYPIKPSVSTISDFLQASKRLSIWFGRNTSAPKITRFNLDSPTFTEQLNRQHPRINTLGDLADWLAITSSELEWFARFWRFDASTPEKLQHYRYELLEKRDGRMRLIEKPKPTLKRLQRQIYQEILSTSNSHPAAHGFCRGKSCLSHASEHVGKRYLLLYDIAECFQSIGWPMVKSVFNRMGYPDAVSTHLTALCTHSVRLEQAQLNLFDATQRDRLRQRHLPQGAPSSPALANAVLHRLDLRLSGLAEGLGLDYSRYADDIAMSGNKHRDWRFLEPVIGGICLDEGVTLNYKKTRIKRSHQKQRVVGIVVNCKVNVDRKYFDTLKAILTNCARYGLDSQNRDEHPQFRAYLLGRIQYVKSLNKQRGLKLEQLYSDINSLEKGC
jgi:RNA-directed DNA polymerase